VSGTHPLDRGFDELRPGESFASKGRTITETDLVSFSALTGDCHPVHADAEWAGESRFGGRIAHGMLLLSYAVGLSEFDPEHVLALRAIDDVTFRRPVRIGDTIRLEGEIEECKEVDDGIGLVRLGWRVTNQRGELAVRAKVTALWQRDREQNAREPAAREVYL
jgi:3-hydroxybutyryl-CoA dehydratase